MMKLVHVSSRLASSLSVHLPAYIIVVFAHRLILSAAKLTAICAAAPYASSPSSRIPSRYASISNARSSLLLRPRHRAAPPAYRSPWPTQHQSVSSPGSIKRAQRTFQPHSKISYILGHMLHWIGDFIEDTPVFACLPLVLLCAQHPCHKSFLK